MLERHNHYQDDEVIRYCESIAYHLAKANHYPDEETWQRWADEQLVSEAEHHIIDMLLEYYTNEPQ